jgi:ABC-type nickel/cobalt efflux system permease component RcnA
MKLKTLLRLLFVASMALLIFVAGLLLLPKWRQMELMRQSEPIHEALKTYHQTPSNRSAFHLGKKAPSTTSARAAPTYFGSEPAWANRGPTVPVKAIGDSALPRMATAFDRAALFLGHLG